MVAQQAMVPIMFKIIQGLEKIAFDEKNCKIISIVKTQLAKVWRLRESAFCIFI